MVTTQTISKPPERHPKAGNDPQYIRHSSTFENL